MNKTYKLAILVGGLSGLLFGFDTAVIAGATDGLKAAFNLNAKWLGISVSAALWGTLFGAFFAGIPGDKFGSKESMKIIALLYIISSLGCYFAPSLEIFIIARVLGGIAIGASSVLAPTYLAEIAPANRRGAIVGIFQLNIVAGILVAYLSNYLVGLLNFGDIEWRVKLGVAAIPSLILFSLVFPIPNSPRWLVAKNRIDEAKATLATIGEKNIDDAISRYANGLNTKAKLSFAQHGKPIMLAFAIAAFNQLSGINAILYYLNDIFAAAGFSKLSSDIQSVAIGATNFAFTLLALRVIDRFGRKKLLMIGSVGLIISLAATAFIQMTGHFQPLLLVMLILFIASFAFSQGAVIWVYISEIFPTEVRARGQSVGSSTHWLFDAIIAMYFPIVAAKSSGLPFVFFAIMMVAQLFVVWRFFPETKGVELEDIKLSEKS